MDYKDLHSLIIIDLFSLTCLLDVDLQLPYYYRTANIHSSAILYSPHSGKVGRVVTGRLVVRIPPTAAAPLRQLSAMFHTEAFNRLPGGRGDSCRPALRVLRPTIKVK
jgi:hypothetical protein